MKATDRMIKESPLYQGEDEAVVYTLTTTPWGSSPGTVTVKLYSMDGEVKTDITSTNLSGDASVDGDVITLPTVTGLTAGVTYRLEVSFICSGSTFEPYITIFGQV